MANQANKLLQQVKAVCPSGNSINQLDPGFPVAKIASVCLRGREEGAQPSTVSSTLVLRQQVKPSVLSETVKHRVHARQPAAMRGKTR